MSSLDTGSTDWVIAFFFPKEEGEVITILVFYVLSGQLSKDVPYLWFTKLC